MAGRATVVHTTDDAFTHNQLLPCMSDASESDEIDAIREKKIEELQSAGRSVDEPIHVDGQEEFQQALADHDLVLVDFYADWCGPCKMIEPIVEKLATETPATVAKVDVDANQALAQQHGVRGIPALLLVKNGEVVERMTGVQEESKLRSLIDRHAA